MKKITLVGGDNRLIILKKKLEKEGFFVDTLGLAQNDDGRVETSDIIIFPVPTTKDKETVFCPLTNRKIMLSEIAKKIDNDKLILSCNYIFENKNNIDFGALDSYALLNAVPTAEGAIKIAIENTDFTLWKSKILVIGYGRVGKILADRLRSLGAFVTVSARKPKDFALITALGFDYINTNSLNLENLSYDIIFNTVDAKVIENSELQDLKCDLMIDLSTFGGFDLKEANECGINALKAPALPVKTAMKTAAEILFETVIQIINS